MSDKEQCKGQYEWDGAHEEVCTLCDRSRTECELRKQIAELTKANAKIKTINDLIEGGNKDYARDLQQIGDAVFDDGVFWICSTLISKDCINRFCATDGDGNFRQIDFKVSEVLSGEPEPIKSNAEIKAEGIREMLLELEREGACGYVIDWDDIMVYLGKLESESNG